MSENVPWGCIGSIGGALIAGICSLVVVVVQRDKPDKQDKPPVPVVSTVVQGGVPSPAPAAETPKLSGTWQGFLVQDMPPVTATFQMDLTQVGNSISGVSRGDVVNTPYFAVITVAGHLGEDRVAALQDQDMRQSRQVPGGWWCFKSMSLQLSSDGNTLAGTWRAPSCSGGTIRLRRS